MPKNEKILKVHYKNIVPAKGLSLNDLDPLKTLLAVTAIYSMIIPLVILDLFAIIYQAVYFYFMGIPYINRSDYIRIDRHKLKRLRLMQKVNCVYCGYANGVLAWVKALANQTERYSCAIKHKQMPKDHEHQKEFYEYADWDD